MSSLGYERMFWKLPKPRKHWCIDCGVYFDSWSLLHGHTELFHGSPIVKSPNLRLRRNKWNLPHKK